MKKPDIKTFPINQSITLTPYAKWQKTTPHTFERKEAVAILAALAIKRPLLVRGEPGCGKTQLARAAAQVLKMPMAFLVVNERTETEDLFWKYDALRRLSDAGDCTVKNIDDINYLTPGPLWWALQHDSAENLDTKNLSHPDLATGSEHPRLFSNNVLLLIDEIDKADRSVPNSLLEALDDYSFTVPYTGETITSPSVEDRPLVIITTNDEQQLPPAFIRRCLVLDIILSPEETEFVNTLTSRGKALFKDTDCFDPDTTCQKVAEMLYKKRIEVQASGSPYLPGQAEYLDHLAAIEAMRLFDQKTSEQDAIDQLADLAYGKNKSR